MIVILGALIIGLTLGLLGSGGSAITVPVLIYLVGHHAKQSIAESMAIVGLISVMAAIPYARAKQIDWRSVWCFGIPGMLGTFMGAWLGGFANEAMQLVAFGFVLITAAVVMLRRPKESQANAQESNDSAERRPSAIWEIALEGTIVGAITGFVGVGGGFLIVPALVVFGRLPMRLGIGTSLIIISFKAAVGFARYQQVLVSHEMSVDIATILTFVLIGAIGSLFGKTLNARMNPRMLRTVFAAFLILLGVVVIYHEGSKLMATAVATPTVKNETTADTYEHASDALLASQRARR